MKRKPGREKGFISKIRGNRHPGFKGENASIGSQRARARKYYKTLGLCEICLKPARDRHHKDGNTNNNEKCNISFLCRKCHMTIDGRLKMFINNKSRFKIKPPSPCIICGDLKKGLRKGRCPKCNEYHRRNGFEREKTWAMSKGYRIDRLTP